MAPLCRYVLGYHRITVFRDLEITCIHPGRGWRASLQDFHLEFQLPRKPLVIVVQKGDIFAGRVLHPAVPGSCLPPIGRVAKIFDPAVAERTYDITGMVRRRIIDDDDLKILIRLSEYAVDGFPQEFTAVVCRD